MHPLAPPCPPLHPRDTASHPVTGYARALRLTLTLTLTLTRYDFALELFEYERANLGRDQEAASHIPLHIFTHPQTPVHTLTHPHTLHTP